MSVYLTIQVSRCQSLNRTINRKNAREQKLKMQQRKKEKWISYTLGKATRVERKAIVMDLTGVLNIFYKICSEFNPFKPSYVPELERAKKKKSNRGMEHIYWPIGSGYIRKSDFDQFFDFTFFGTYVDSENKLILMNIFM